MANDEIIGGRRCSRQFIILLRAAKITQKVKGQGTVQRNRTFICTKAHGLIKQTQRFKWIFSAHSRRRQTGYDAAIAGTQRVGTREEVQSSIGIPQSK